MVLNENFSFGRNVIGNLLLASSIASDTTKKIYFHLVSESGRVNIATSKDLEIGLLYFKRTRTKAKERQTVPNRPTPTTTAIIATTIRIYGLFASRMRKKNLLLLLMFLFFFLLFEYNHFVGIIYS